MIEIGSGALTDVLQALLNVLGPGAGRLTADSRNLVALLGAFEVLLMALFWVHGSEEVVKNILKKILTIFFFIWVIEEYQTILSWVTAGFQHAGERAAGGTNFRVMENPSLIVDLGYGNAYELLQLAVRLGGDWNFFDAAIVLFTSVVILFSYYVLAIQIFLTRVEFALVATLGILLLPFSVFKPTAFLGEKVFSAVVSFGIKFMVLSLLVSLAFPLLSSLTVPEDPAWGDMFNIMVATLALSVLILHAPGVASSLLSGSPSLGGGAVSSGVGVAKGAVLGSFAGAALAAKGTGKTGVGAVTTTQMAYRAAPVAGERISSFVGNSGAFSNRGTEENSNYRKQKEDLVERLKEGEVAPRIREKESE